MLTLTLTSVTVKRGDANIAGCSVVSSFLEVSMSLPSHTKPLLPSWVTILFSVRILVISPVPTTQGIPNSRDTIAAWQVTPPSSVMIPLALFIAGTMSGVVITVTKMSPS